jgi:hypothetical protein
MPVIKKALGSNIDVLVAGICPKCGWLIAFPGETEFAVRFNPSGIKSMSAEERESLPAMKCGRPECNGRGKNSSLPLSLVTPVTPSCRFFENCFLKIAHGLCDSASIELCRGFCTYPKA